MFLPTIENSTAVLTLLGLLHLPTNPTSLDLDCILPSATHLLRNVRHHVLDLLSCLNLAHALLAYRGDDNVDKGIGSNVQKRHWCEIGFGARGFADRAFRLTGVECGVIVFATNRHYCRGKILLVLGVSLVILRAVVDEIGGERVRVFEDGAVVAEEVEAHWNGGHFGIGKFFSFGRRCRRKIEKFRLTLGFDERRMSEGRETRGTRYLNGSSREA